MTARTGRTTGPHEPTAAQPPPTPQEPIAPGEPAAPHEPTTSSEPTGTPRIMPAGGASAPHAPTAVRAPSVAGGAAPIDGRRDAAEPPVVGVVIATHDRPTQLREAIAAVLGQGGERVHVVVVYDRAEPDPSLAGEAITVLRNDRTPGLAGARNTGIRYLAALAVELVAFCDDDDVWLPGKLAAQLAALAAHPGAEFATCGIEVAYDGAVRPRLAGTDVVDLADLTRSRMSMLHASTFLIRAAALRPDRLGLVAEDAPGSQNEDYDLLLRAARRRPIVHVDRPLTRVRWGGSFFTHRYRTKIDSLHWMLRRHPELSACRPGAARLYGQLACWHAAVGDRRAAVRYAGRSLRRNPREPRAAIALAAAARLVRVESVLSTLHRRGRGI